MSTGVVPVSNLGWRQQLFGQLFCGFSSISPEKRGGSASNWAMATSFHVLYNSSFKQLTVCGDRTERVVSVHP